MQSVDRLLFSVMNSHGPMTNSEIYREVRKRSRRERIRLTPHWRATIRNTLQRHAEGHPKCKAKPLFVHVDRALWKARKPKR